MLIIKKRYNMGMLNNTNFTSPPSEGLGEA
jgi:hypothetical protein